MTEAVQRVAQRGRVILLGRSAAHLVADAPDCRHVRRVAPRSWRAARIARRESWTTVQALARGTEMDRARRQFHRYFFGDAAAIIREIVTREPAAASARGADKPVLTLARELGAGDQGFAPPLAERLGLDIVDRDLLEEEAERGRPGACGIRGHAALGRCGGRAVRPASSGRALESRVHCR